jgi:hypothetical protein
MDFQAGRPQSGEPGALRSIHSELIKAAINLRAGINPAPVDQKKELKLALMIRNPVPALDIHIYLRFNVYKY